MTAWRRMAIRPSGIGSVSAPRSKESRWRRSSSCDWGESVMPSMRIGLPAKRRTHFGGNESTRWNTWAFTASATDMSAGYRRSAGGEEDRSLAEIVDDRRPPRAHGHGDRVAVRLRREDLEPVREGSALSGRGTRGEVRARLQVRGRVVGAGEDHADLHRVVRLLCHHQT